MSPTVDINVALANARRLSALLLQVMDQVDGVPDADDVAELADAFEAIDNWLSMGGFLPTDWKR